MTDIERAIEDFEKRTKCGDCIHFQPAWLCRKIRNTGGKNSPINNYPDFERKTMPNIKITAEVDGKRVPLETVSTETFEAIKALEKPKEIPVPVARTGYFHMCPSERRLLLKVTPNIRKHVAELREHILAIDTTTGVVAAWWEEENNEKRTVNYENIKPL